MTPTREQRRYAGVWDEEHGGMTPRGNIIRDAWVFGLLPEDEDGKGWTPDRFDALYARVFDAWAPYGHLASRLPPDLAERHRRIYDKAIEHARSKGWNPEIDEDESV